jgi:hypothetical protein
MLRKEEEKNKKRKIRISEIILAVSVFHIKEEKNGNFDMFTN